MAKAESVSITPPTDDANLLAGLNGIEEALAILGRRGGAARYGEVCQKIEELAFAIRLLPATTPQALTLKARVVANLNGPGIACYAGRVLAASLGQDVLARENVR